MPANRLTDGSQVRRRQVFKSFDGAFARELGVGEPARKPAPDQAKTGGNLATQPTSTRTDARQVASYMLNEVEYIRTFGY